MDQGLPAEPLEQSISLYEFTRALKQCWTKFSVDDPQRWSVYAPGGGHSLFSALLGQEVYGGFVVLNLVFGERYHYSNVLLDGTQIDFCSEHLGDSYQIERTAQRVNRANLNEELLPRFYKFREMYRSMLAYNRLGNGDPADEESSYAYI